MSSIRLALPSVFWRKRLSDRSSLPFESGEAPRLPHTTRSSQTDVEFPRVVRPPRSSRPDGGKGGTKTLMIPSRWYSLSAAIFGANSAFLAKMQRITCNFA
jgi:hypothetical protein